jgi:hypothetical protein
MQCFSSPTCCCACGILCGKVRESCPEQLSGPCLPCDTRVLTISFLILTVNDESSQNCRT